MGNLVCMGAMLQCSFGMTPSSLLVAEPMVLSTTPSANILDFVPMENILPFGMCTSLTNPQVASATAAAMGVLTPMPCIPVVVAPWLPGVENVLVRMAPALDDSCKALCTWTGEISIVSPGQFTVFAG